MKKTVKNPFLKATFVLLFLLIALVSRAQLCVPLYPVINHSNCTVRYTYKIFDVTNCATTSWGSGSIAPLGTLNISSITVGAEDIELIIEFSSTISTPSLNYGAGPPPGGGAWTCYNSGAPATQSDSGPGLLCNVPSFTYLVQVNCTHTDIW